MMIYRTLGRTGLKVSQLGIGCMRLPTVQEGDAQHVDREAAVAMIHEAFRGGVNYIDTAVFYHGGESQIAVGEALKGWRDKVVVSTKNHYYGEDEKEWWGHLETSLKNLQVDSIDIYNHHGINWKVYCENVQPRVGAWMLKAQQQGLIKHICASFHDDNDGLMKLIDSGYPSVITLQYNMLNRAHEEGIARAHAKGIGVVVMGPVAGGRLGASSEVLEGLIPNIQRVPELALRFVLANPNVSVALSGMSTLQQVRENVATASDGVALTPADREAIVAHMARLKKLADLYCTGCRYCMPCPAEVNIPSIFDKFNTGNVYGMWDIARQGYAGIGVAWDPGKRADACTECGKCREKCPQKIDIPAQLEKAHQLLKG
ncbi:MAG: aldo/keto reductase [Planctomycetaceae bacterium]|nr:aldo/keto reductase [Planctomycetaceae bacterium]